MTDPAQDPRAALVRSIAQAHLDERGPLLPILHDVTDELGHVSVEDVETIAQVLNLSHADVHGVVSFYHDFRTSPRAAHTLTLCRAEACQAVGAQALFDQTTARSGSLGQDVAVHEVFCLGNCALGPSGTVDGRLHGRLSTSRVDALTAGWRS